jgi:hypothetical protein
VRINSEHSAERSRARNLSKAVRQRISEQSAPSSTNTEQACPESPTQPHSPAEPQSHVLPNTEDSPTVPVAIAPLPRQSNRSHTHKRTRYEPAAMGQGPTNSNAFMASTEESPLNHLIVDTGASHVLFRERDSSMLCNIQMSELGSPPFALLKAENGALLGEECYKSVP